MTSKFILGTKVVEDTTDTGLRSRLITQKSKIHGLGLYSTQDFHANTLVWTEKLTYKGVTPENDGPLRWTNHSDEPNCILFMHTSKEGIIRVSLITKEYIPMGEEITYNYNVFGHRGYISRCNCGSKNCQETFNLRMEWGERK